VCYSPYQGFKYVGTITVTLSNEFTTAQLIAEAESQLASASYATGACSATRDLASDETSIALSKCRYRFQIPSLPGYSCYRIEHDQGTYEWDGQATVTPWYYVDPPSTDGTNEVGEGTAACDGC